LPQPPEKHRNANGVPLVLAVRYFYHLPPGALFNHLLFPTAAVKLLAKRIWHESLAGIKKVPFFGETSNAPPQGVADKTAASTTNSSITIKVSQEVSEVITASKSGSSPATSLPQEVSEVITASKSGSSPATGLPQDVVNAIVEHLMHDVPSLLACSLTSWSWSAAAAPHLYRTLSTHISKCGDERTTWPNPIRKASKFGWLPYVARLFINKETRADRFSPSQFDHQTQLEFSALTNVQELYISDLDIPSFVPLIKQYFGQFSPTVKSLTLIGPKGTDRQIVFFIGLFQHLEDLWLDCDLSDFSDEKGDDLTLVPRFVPPLRGCLTAINTRERGLAKTMIDLFGGLSFRRLDISGSDETQLLVYACANALEELWLNATDICGEIPYSKGVRVVTNDFAGGLYHRDLDLSRSGSLQKIQIEAKHLIFVLGDRAPDTVPSVFRAIMSSINSPAFSDFVVVYQAGDFHNVFYSRKVYYRGEAMWYGDQFEVFREMRKARNFRLVLQACCVSDISVRELERALAVEKAKGGLPRLSWSYTLAPR